MGQFNMAGRGELEGELKTLSHAGVYMLDKNSEWKPAKNPVHFDKPDITGVGPGLSFGIEMAKADSTVRIGLIPCDFYRKNRKLVLLVIIAFVWCYKAGIYLHLISPILLRKHGRKAKSIFKYGLDLIASILLNSQNQSNIDISKFLSCTYNYRSN